MNKELNAAEAVYGFVGWLTSREERTVMSAKDDCAPIAELIKTFLHRKQPAGSKRSMAFELDTSKW